MDEKEMKKEVEKIVKKVIGKKLSDDKMEYLFTIFKAEFRNAVSRNLSEDYALSLARYYTKLEAEKIKKRGGQ